MQFYRLLFRIIGACICFVPSLQASLWFVYTTSGDISNGDVNIFNIATNTPTPASPIIISDVNPIDIVITPDNQTAYVIQGTSANLLPIDLTTNTPKAPIMLPSGAVPIQIAISPDGATAFVSSTSLPPELFRIDLTTQTISSLTIGGLSDFVKGVAITPDGKKVYIANYNQNNVIIVDVASFSIDSAGPISVGIQPLQVVMTPNNQKALVLNHDDNTVSVIDLKTNIVTDVIIIPANHLNGIAITPDGTLAYVSSLLDNTVTPIDLSTNLAGTPISLVPTNDFFPLGIAFTPDSQTAFVANFASNTLARLDGIKNMTPIITSFALAGSFGFLPIITPDQAPKARFSFIAAEAGEASTFDASASNSPVGSIAKYTWNFGDHSPEVTVETPMIQHVFKKTGKYSVTLTVTNSAGTSTSPIYTGQVVSNNGGPSALSTKRVTIKSLGPVLPPINLHSQQVMQEFATQTDLINMISWNPPSSSNVPVSYPVYRDAALTKLIGTVLGAAKMKFADHNRNRGISYTYYVVSVGSNGKISKPASITVSPSRVKK